MRLAHLTPPVIPRLGKSIWQTGAPRFQTEKVFKLYAFSRIGNQPKLFPRMAQTASAPNYIWNTLYTTCATLHNKYYMADSVKHQPNYIWLSLRRFYPQFHIVIHIPNPGISADLGFIPKTGSIFNDVAKQYCWRSCDTLPGTLLPVVFGYLAM